MVDAPKNAVPVGTVGGVQLAAVLKSELPGAVDQVASWARAGMAASNAAAAVVANKYARIPLAPLRGDSLNADRLALTSLSIIYARGKCFLSQAAPICCSLWLRGHGCETKPAAPKKVIKYTIALPAVAAGMSLLLTRWAAPPPGTCDACFGPVSLSAAEERHGRLGARARCQETIRSSRTLSASARYPAG